MSNDQSEVLAYVHLASHEPIVSALETVLGPLVRDFDFTPGQFLYNCGSSIILIGPSEDDFLSIWIRMHPHWASDVEFGHFLFQATGATVRCDPGASFPEVHPYSNVFLEIGEDGEKLVEWG